MASISEKFGNILEEAYNTLRDPSGRRRGAQAYYNVLESGQDLNFQTEEGHLSDHPALYLKLKIN